MLNVDLQTLKHQETPNSQLYVHRQGWDWGCRVLMEQHPELELASVHLTSEGTCSSPHLRYKDD